MVSKFGETAKKRFPHLAYGQDPNSETFKKSYPDSYKRYFFRLVKSIIVTGKKGNKKMLLQPPAIVMAVGARVPTL